MPTTKWWVKAPKGANVKVAPPDPETQPEPVKTPKASKAKAEVDIKDA